MSLSNCFSSIDMFSTASDIHVRGRRKTYSFCGLIVTLLIVVVAALLLYIFSSNMIHKSNPAFTQYTKFGDISQSEDFAISDDTFPIAFSA